MEEINEIHVESELSEIQEEKMKEKNDSEEDTFDDESDNNLF